MDGRDQQLLQIRPYAFNLPSRRGFEPYRTIERFLDGISDCKKGATRPIPEATRIGLALKPSTRNLEDRWEDG
ncbi:unnamed protein product [Fusarium langsethiae]|nr:unnamed protein product [Fusarium langsethiae]